MEHILQFGINIDDDAIRRRIEESAAKSTVDEFKKQIFDLYNFSGDIRGFTPKAETIIRDVLDTYKDEIIERASELVAESIKRSKKYKDTLAKVTAEV